MTMIGSTRGPVVSSDVLSSPRLAGQVKRYHTWPVLRPQTVAEHAWRVATLYCEVWGTPRAEVLYWCLHHDSGELLAGDVPFHGKRHSTALAEAVNAVERDGLVATGLVMPLLTDDELRRAKAADLLEMWEFGRQEMTMGNRYAEPIVASCVGALDKLMTGHADGDAVERRLGGRP